ncbi:hypothetical protein NX774_04425 [Massilia agilis]|uniref:Uncharacterized protein n=1 Tax=Massilia agilis TaxID=1811226 RepID=A0ABT2D7B3_9BURK|nr:hypothetical protein [Massilia agilis]MCS0807164.1 hypothetical protein [Massilia agilis]
MLLLPLAMAGSCAPAATFDHLSGGEQGTLRVEFELKGKEDGRPIHRTVVMVLRMESDESFEWADDHDVAGLAGAAAQREQAMAGASAGMNQLDMAAIARTCDRAPDSAECKAGQKAMADAMAQVDSAMRTGLPANGSASPYKDRGHSWHGLMAGTACGTIEGRLLDPGRPGGTTRIPTGANDGSSMATCLHKIIVDRKSNTARLMISPFEVARPDKQERGYYLIEALDLAGNANVRTENGVELRNIPFNGNRPAGTATYRGPRGVTTVRWTFERQ